MHLVQESRDSLRLVDEDRPNPLAFDLMKRFQTQELRFLGVLEEFLRAQEVYRPGRMSPAAADQRAFSGLPGAEQKERALFRKINDSIYHDAGLQCISASL